MKNEIKKIGVFDSGVGGLTVLKELKETFPQKDFFYLGDTARVPYGIRSQETIQKYALQDAEFLKNLGAELIVVACNTATAYALSFLQERFDMPILGVIEPGVDQALQVTQNQRIGIIATEATISSKRYQNFLTSKNSKVECFSKATPSLVSFIEEGLFDKNTLGALLHYYLKDFKKHNIDTLILGCTHYPVIHFQISEYFEDKIHIVNSASRIAKVLQTNFKSEEKVFRTGECHIYLTDTPKRSQDLVKTILKDDLTKIQKVNL